MKKMKLIKNWAFVEKSQVPQPPSYYVTLYGYAVDELSGPIFASACTIIGRSIKNLLQ